MGRLTSRPGKIKNPDISVLSLPPYGHQYSLGTTDIYLLVCLWTSIFPREDWHQGRGKKKRLYSPKKTSLYACEHQYTRGKIDIKAREDKNPRHIGVKFGPVWASVLPGDNWHLCLWTSIFPWEDWHQGRGREKIPDISVLSLTSYGHQYSSSNTDI